MTHEDTPLPKTINSFTAPARRSDVGIPIEDDAAWRRKRKNLPTVGRRRNTGVNKFVVAATGIGLMALGGTWVANSPLNNGESHPGLTQNIENSKDDEKDSRATHFNTGDIKIEINNANIRTSPYIDELDEGKPANIKRLSDLDSINGIPTKDIKKTDSLVVRNAKVDEQGGTVPDVISSTRWIELDIVEDGEAKKGYISDGYNTRNANIISTLKPGPIERIVKDGSGNIILPSDGLNYTEIISSSQTSSK